MSASTRAQVIRFHEVGGPEVLRLDEMDVGPPGPEEAQLRQTAVGLNFIDVYDRTGLYPTSLPSGIGREAAGVVMALGRKVRGFKVGDRVAYVLPRPGAYCDVRNVPADRLVKIPKGVSDQQAAAIMLKGLTAHYLLRRTYRVRRGEDILVHAAAGGVGLLLCQWAKALGVKVIGVVGSEAKADLARKNGCRHVILLGKEDLVARVKQITRGAGVAVVYDSVGKDTFFQSLDSLRPLGMMVSFGNASGPVPPANLGVLSLKGSLYVQRPTLGTHQATREAAQEGADDLFAMVASGKVKIPVERRYPLAEAGQAHRDLEGRGTTGAGVLHP